MAENDDQNELMRFAVCSELRKNILMYLNDGEKSLNTGKIISLKLSDFSDAALVLKKHERFWLEHDMSGIPVHLMEKIGWLKDSVLFTDTELDIFKVHSNFINPLKDAKEVKLLRHTPLQAAGHVSCRSYHNTYLNSNNFICAYPSFSSLVPCFST